MDILNLALLFQSFFPSNPGKIFSIIKSKPLVENLEFAECRENLWMATIIKSVKWLWLITITKRNSVKQKNKNKLRSSHLRCSMSKDVLRNFIKSTGKYLY